MRQLLFLRGDMSADDRTLLLKDDFSGVQKSVIVPNRLSGEAGKSIPGILSLLKTPSAFELLDLRPIAASLLRQ